MITIQNGKFIIPDNDRFVGFAGDNTVNTKQLHLLDRAGEGCTYTLCLRFDDDSVCSVPLTAEVDGAGTVLTWQIRREQLYAAGIVTAQLKTVDSDGGIAHSTKDFFVIGASVELDENGGDREYVTPSQLRNSINQALQTASSTAPYVGEDGCWYVYDPESGDYTRTEHHISGREVDSAMSDSSMNAVGNSVIKRYADQKAESCRSFVKTYTDLVTSDAVKNTRAIAGLTLTDDISAARLADSLLPSLYVRGVIPGRTRGKQGQIGIGPNGEVYCCTEQDRWIRVAVDWMLDEKMNLIEEADAEDIEDIDEGCLFISNGKLYMKHDGAAAALIFESEVYSKTEINNMLGDVESLLAAV